MNEGALALPVSFGPDGLVPAVIRDETTGDVLMVGFLNLEALERTRESGFVHYWSRSRQKLWLKGETSGHVQRVREIHVNCELNTLLIDVEQMNAVCHDGFPTCFYRRLEPDNSLTTVRDRQFDPDDVYAAVGGIATATRMWWAAYETLLDSDLTRESRTSTFLHANEDLITERIVAEIRELAGVLDGSHRHAQAPSGQVDDVQLEGAQVLYWIALRCVRDGLSWDEVRPDRALDPPRPEDVASADVLAALLHSQAERWDDGSEREVRLQAFESMRLVANCCVLVDVTPVSLIRADLDELRTRPYLAEFFTTWTGSIPG